jgi:hypothetical protein
MQYKVMLRAASALEPSTRACVKIAAYNSLYDFLQKVICNLNCNSFFLMCVDMQLQLVSEG